MRKVPKFLHVLLNSDDVDSAEYKAAVAQLEREPIGNLPWSNWL